MSIKQEVNINKDKIEKIKNEIKDLDKELKRINDELLKDKKNNKLELNKEKEQLLSSIHKLKELQNELEFNLVNFAISNGYDVTTEDIAVILDSTTDYVTRKLKQEIEHINITFDAYKYISDFKKFNILEIYNLHKKGIFFYREDVKEFLKKHLFNLEDEVDLLLDVSDINLDPETIFKETKEYLKGKAKRYEFTNHIDEETLEKILDGRIRLSKLSTIKALVYEKKVLEDCDNMKKMITKIYEDTLVDIDEDILRKQYDLIKEFALKEHRSLDKKTSIIHDMQVNRFIKTRGYTKYNLVHTSKGMALYDTAIKCDVANEEDIKKHTEKTNYISQGKLKIRVLNSLVYEGLGNEIRAYLKTIQR